MPAAYQASLLFCRYPGYYHIAEGWFPDMDDVFLGRQPIFDRNQRVFAYELLFRGNTENHAEIENEDLATSQILLNTLTQFGLQNVVGEAHAFINLTESFILGKLPLPSNSRQLVLEILETIKLTPKILEGIQRLKKMGFQIALDDFIFHPHLAPLVQIADIVKLDVLQFDKTALQAHVNALRRYPVKLLAEKVETPEMYEYCLQLGFDYFQGYFICKPNILKCHHLPSNRLALLNLLNKICDPEIDIDELTHLVAQDVTLSFRLLRYLNSSRHGLDHKIDSVRSAILLLGMSTVRNFISLMLITSMHDKPPELFVTAFIRASMCEQLGARADKKLKPRYFTVGLFSIIDAILDQPMATILERLSLDDPLTAAILRNEGPIGSALAQVIAYERGEWNKLDLSAIEQNELQQIYLNTVQASQEFMASIAHANAA